MAIVVTAEVLQAIAQGHSASPGERGLILLGLAAPELDEASRARLPVGRRDALLLDFHVRRIGTKSEALADCPQCAEKLELEVPLAAIRADGGADPDARFQMKLGVRTICYRLPTVGDLAALGADPALRGVEAATLALARICRVTAPGEGSLTTDEETALASAVAGAVETHDPQAHVLLELDCPACGAHWSAPFDIVEFLWRRLEAGVTALLRDVHVIASAYGWNERDILALDPFRRQRYLELIRA